MTILKHESLIPFDEELRGFSRTIAEIDWLILIVVAAFQFIRPLGEEGRTAIMMSLCFFAAFILSFRYANFCKRETRWKLAIETLAMTLFISWVVWYSGRLESPLVSLYLLPIIASALALGKLATLAQLGAVTKFESVAEAPGIRGLEGWNISDGHVETCSARAELAQKIRGGFAPPHTLHLV
jgi:hypothetical protein